LSLFVYCYVIGLLIAAIVLYTATIEHARDYAVIKALGGRMRFLVATAIVEALLLSVCGFGVGWILATGLGVVFDHWRPVLQAQLPVRLVMDTFVLFVMVNLVATVPPILHLRRVDPQEVFKA
jgi:putative ABC transport system permease protein